MIAWGNEKNRMNTEIKSWTITGTEAIRIAERDGVTLRKYADTVEGYRDSVSLVESREIAKQDASLIYCIVQPTGWTGPAEGYNVADYFGASYAGPDEDGVEPTWQDA